MPAENLKKPVKINERSIDTGKYVIGKEKPLVKDRRYRITHRWLESENFRGKKQHPHYLVYKLYDPVDDKDVIYSTLSFIKDGFVITGLEKVSDIDTNQEHLSENAKIVAIDTTSWTSVHGNNFVTNNLWVFSKEPALKYSEAECGKDYFVYTDKYSSAVRHAAMWALLNGYDKIYLQNTSVIASRAYGVARQVLGDRADEYIRTRLGFAVNESNQDALSIQKDSVENGKMLRKGDWVGIKNNRGACCWKVCDVDLDKDQAYLEYGPENAPTAFEMNKLVLPNYCLCSKVASELLESDEDKIYEYMMNREDLTYVDKKQISAMLGRL